MKIYLVGGAVRDKILGIPVNDKDYLVVGSTPEEMVKLGYKPIGKDFPVFLHPKTNEEYALARTERKVGKGYHGFTFYTSPEVTLEEDLIRRDISINAIAEDEDGNIFDPYNGLRDIENKIIRHVSNAFIEDPLRVLRVARFAALDTQFNIQTETLLLMKKMVESGELKSLSTERIVVELNKGLNGKNPDIMLHCLCECRALNELLPGLNPDQKLSNYFVEVGKEIKENHNSLTAESKMIMLLLVPYFAKQFSIDDTYITEQHDGLLKNLKTSAKYKKIYNGVKNENSNIVNFLSLSSEDKLNCLYRLDFFRRPNIIFEILNVSLIFYKVFGIMIQKHIYDAIRDFLTLFTGEIQKLRQEVNLLDSGEEIKNQIYNERLSALNKISS